MITKVLLQMALVLVAGGLLVSASCAVVNEEDGNKAALPADATEAATTAAPQEAPTVAQPATGRQQPSPYAKWENGPPTNPNFFPIAVWLQSPRNAAKYKAIGINTYIGLHKGPTEEQLAELKKQGMYVICDQNEVGLKHKDDKMIIAWMHGDEPDNAHPIGTYWKSPEEIKAAWPEAPLQPLEKWGKWGPPVPPKKIIADYELLKQRDPSRPVWMNLGQGVAWDEWVGRGIRTNKPQDYVEYVKGADIISYDIYPVNQDRPQVKNQHWMVPYGVERLIQWTDNRKPIWNVVECTPYSGADRRPSPEVVRSQVWMSIIQGSRGIVYFVHVFNPEFIEAGLLADEEMAKAVGILNKQISDLAPVLNSPTLDRLATVRSSNDKTPINALVKRHDGSTYVFAAAMRDGATRGTFAIQGLVGNMQAEVLGEDRRIEVHNGRFIDEFDGYDIHLYKISPRQAGVRPAAAAPREQAE